MIELNGAVEFNDEYSLGSDVFAAAMKALVDAAIRLAREPLAALAYALNLLVTGSSTTRMPHRTVRGREQRLRERQNPSARTAPMRECG